MTVLKRLDSLANAIALALLCCASSQSFAAQAERWDYTKNPVQITEVPPPKGQVVGTTWPPDMAATAFDGFGAQGVAPAAIRGWHHPAIPTPENPAICEIDYGKPAAVSAFAHYFYVPGSRDLRFLSPAPSAFRRVRILSRTDDRGPWTLVTTLSDLPLATPQVLPVNASEAARYWRLEVLELAAGAEMLMSYEIETYTGGVPHIVPVDLKFPDLPAAFAKHVRVFRPSIGTVRSSLRLAESRRAIDVQLQNGGQSSSAEVTLTSDNEPAALIPSGANSWHTELQGGHISVQSEITPMGVLLNLTYVASQEQPVRYRKAALEMSASNVSLYYMPAYAWSKEPVNVVAMSANLQTRLAAMETGGMSVCLVPGTDRGKIGFRDGKAHNDLLLGPSPTPVLLTAVAGDWWATYRFAVHDIYAFREPQQTVPVSEIQYGISRYMVQADGVWDSALGTDRSWPQSDPHSSLIGFYAFGLYGTPYSVPTYWARYVMNSDKLARDRCRSMVLWMCRSGVRVQQGPARGAFFTLQEFKKGEEPKLAKQGGTWSPVPVLTSQSTGAALWTLLYYRAVSGEHNTEINQAIEEAASWLLKTQTPEGGWPYGYDLEAKPLLRTKLADGRSVDTASSSGCIWNVWSLWRLGKETGNKAYLEAAERGKRWFAGEFIAKHHYHGYWEDVGPGSREGYEAAIAAVALAEMGEKQFAIEAARDAVQWVFTRQIEPRDAINSAGLVAEQTGWPPASYCNPMMGLAAWTAWQATGDDFWRPFAMIPKAIGWWYQPDLGATVWIVDSTQMAPIVGPAFESYWSDWTVAQVGTLTLRWLVREVNRRAAGAARVNEETLTGTLLGQEVQAWAPRGGLRPIVPLDGQVNWLGFKSSDSLFVVLFNSGSDGKVGVNLSSRNINGVEGAAVWPKAIHRLEHGRVTSLAWNGRDLVELEHEGTVLLEWGFKN